jgi:Tol biopolymer transport system component
MVLVLLRFGQRPAPPPLARMNILLPEKSRALSLAVSPDGRFAALVLVKDGKEQIWIRALDSADITPLAGTDGAADPFWSPESHFIAFFADSRLKKIERSGGPVQTICDALGALGGTWNRNGVILIGGLWRPQTVSDAGGTAADLPGHMVTEIYPSFLPDGRHYIATRSSSGVWLGSIDGAIDDRGERRILPDVSNAQVVAPPSGGPVGAVIFTRAGTLTALPFDLKKLEAAGEPYSVADGVVGRSFTRKSLASASSTGLLAWVSGEGRNWQYVWRNRQGKDLGSAGEAGSDVRISPDGKRVLGDHLSGGLWVLEFATGVSTRLGFDAANMSPVWSPDGKYVALFGPGGIYREAVNGAGKKQLLLKTDVLSFPKSWSPDGRYLIYAQVSPTTGSADLIALAVAGDQGQLVLAGTPANEGQGEFSPDGRWVAYTSNESGLSEIYVIPFPPTPNGGRWMVSHGGGVQPRWRRDGRELFYISPDGTMIAVPVSTAPVFQAGIPQAVFNTDMVDTGIRTGPMSWDIAPDGKRFLIISDKSQETSSLNVILNWRPGEQN